MQMEMEVSGVLASGVFGLLVYACSDGRHAYAVAQTGSLEEKSSKFLVAGQQPPDTSL